MQTERARSWLPANLLLLAFLAAAQSGALVHAFEHEAGTPQVQGCAVCVTVVQLDTSSVDALVTMNVEACRAFPAVSRQPIPRLLHALTARQRAPPQTL